VAILKTVDLYQIPGLNHNSWAKRATQSSKLSLKSLENLFEIR